MVAISASDAAVIVATIPDAAIAEAPPLEAAAVANVAKPDVKRRRPDSDDPRMDDADLARFADMLTSEGPKIDGSDMSRRRPGADLGLPDQRRS